MIDSKKCKIGSWYWVKHKKASRTWGTMLIEAVGDYLGPVEQPGDK